MDLANQLNQQIHLENYSNKKIKVMKEFPSCISIIEKFIQSEIDINHSSNEYILALNECTTLEDLIEEVKVWKNHNVIENYGSVENYILMGLDREYN